MLQERRLILDREYLLIHKYLNYYTPELLIYTSRKTRFFRGHTLMAPK